MYNVRIIPTVYKKLGQAPQYSYEISFQESLHRVRNTVIAYFGGKLDDDFSSLMVWSCMFQGLRISPGMTSLNLDAPGQVDSIVEA